MYPLKSNEKDLWVDGGFTLNVCNIKPVGRKFSNERLQFSHNII